MQPLSATEIILLSTLGLSISGFLLMVLYYFVSIAG